LHVFGHGSPEFRERGHHNPSVITCPLEEMLKTLPKFAVKAVLSKV
jgi:hypothetical protein